MAKAVYITNNQRKNLFETTGVCSNNPKRDQALLALVLGTPMKVIELSRLTVADVLSESGDFLKDCAMRPELAFNGKPRPLSWESKRLREYVGWYLDYRKKVQFGQSNLPGAYLGLDPESPLILTDDGKPFPLDRRTTPKGTITYTCSSMTRLISKRMSEAGIEGGTAESGRRTFAVNLQRHGGSHKLIHDLLGNANLKTTRRLLDSDPEDLGAIASKAF
jgi:integrase